MATLPKDAPTTPEIDGLTDDEAEGVREAMAEVDRGEGIAAADAFAQVREELEALARLEEQRARARRTG